MAVFVFIVLMTESLIWMAGRKGMKKYLISNAIATLLLLTFTNCGNDEKEDPDTDVDSIVLYVNKTKELGITGDFLTSDNSFVASVSKEGIVTGNHIGTTYINTKKKRIPTTVMGMYHLYDDPVLEWGCSQSTVRSKQKQGTLSNVTETALTYKNAGSATAVGYTFENGKLKSVGVILEPRYASSISEHLMERYFMVPYVSGDLMAMGYDTYDVENAKVSVGILVYGTNIVVMYINPQNNR